MTEADIRYIQDLKRVASGSGPDKWKARKTLVDYFQHNLYAMCDELAAAYHVEHNPGYLSSLNLRIALDSLQPVRDEVAA